MSVFWRQGVEADADRDGLSLTRVLRRLEMYFRPLVDEARLRPQWATALGTANPGLTLIAGIARRRVAVAGHPQLFDDTTTDLATSNTAALITPAPHLLQFYSEGRYAAGGPGFGYEIQDSNRLVQHARQVVRDGIAAETAMKRSWPAVGEPVDVVLIDKIGARFVT